MAHEEIKQEICSNFGISQNELSRLACLKKDEKGVTEEGALKLVKRDLENRNKPSQAFVDSVNAEEYLTDYAKKNHPEDPDWYQRTVEKEYKGGRQGIEEEDAIRLSAMSYGWSPGGESINETVCGSFDSLSEKSLSEKISNGRIARLTARINRLSTERSNKWNHRYKTRSRGVELTDGTYSIWLNCYDTTIFKNDYGRLIPANPMLERIRTLEERTNLIGAVVTVTQIEAGRNRKGFITLSTGPDSEFIVGQDDLAGHSFGKEAAGVGA